MSRSTRQARFSGGSFLFLFTTVAIAIATAETPLLVTTLQFLLEVFIFATSLIDVLIELAFVVISRFILFFMSLFFLIQLQDPDSYSELLELLLLEEW